MSFFITEAKDCESAYNVITNPESGVLILLFRHKYAATKIRAFIQAKFEVAFEYMPDCKLFYYNVH
jgi:hypothetical protein